jgi:cation-transporting ATPase E
VYPVVIAVVVVLADWHYPFLPRHLTIISDFTIGIPGFFLALAPNTRRYIPGFIRRVLRFCLPAGVVVAGGALIAYGVAFYGNNQSLTESRTTATLVVAVIALWVLVVFARPINWWRGLLVAAMIAAVATIVAVPAFRSFFALDLPSGHVLWQAALIAAVGVVLVEFIWRFTRVLDRGALGAAPATASGEGAPVRR